MFKELDSSCTSKVKIVNGDFIEVKGKGVVAVETHSGTKLIIDVLFVPKIDQNLLSVGQFLEKNYYLVFKDKACIIHDPIGHEMFVVLMKGKCFSLDFPKANSIAYSSTLNESALWHRRLEHFNYTALNQMYKNELVLNMPAI